MDYIRTTLAIASIFLAHIPSVTAQGVLKAAVIRQSFAGNTADIAGKSGSTFVFWAEDGEQRMQNKDSIRDSGTWRITPEGEFCGTWKKLRNGTESCAPVIDLGGGSYQWGNARFQILMGNPKEL
jgi:hypothetical protein